MKRDHLGDTLLIRCESCGELFEVDPDDFNFDWESSYADDRGMGYEIELNHMRYVNVLIVADR